MEGDAQGCASIPAHGDMGTRWGEVPYTNPKSSTLISRGTADKSIHKEKGSAVPQAQHAVRSNSSLGSRNPSAIGLLGAGTPGGVQHTTYHPGQYNASLLLFQQVDIPRCIRVGMQIWEQRAAVQSSAAPVSTLHWLRSPAVPMAAAQGLFSDHLHRGGEDFQVHIPTSRAIVQQIPRAQTA